MCEERDRERKRGKEMFLVNNNRNCAFHTLACTLERKKRKHSKYVCDAVYVMAVAMKMVVLTAAAAAAGSGRNSQINN